MTSGILSRINGEKRGHGLTGSAREKHSFTLRGVFSFRGVFDQPRRVGCRLDPISRLSPVYVLGLDRGEDECMRYASTDNVVQDARCAYACFPGHGATSLVGDATATMSRTPRLPIYS